MRKDRSVKIELGGIEFEVVSLMEPLREDTEVYPGDPKPKKTIFSDIAKSLVNLYGIIPKGKHADFSLQTSPVAVTGATGGPVTAFAFIKKE